MASKDQSKAPTRRTFTSPTGERAVTTSAVEATNLLARGYTEAKRPASAKKADTPTETK